MKLTRIKKTGPQIPEGAIPKWGIVTNKDREHLTLSRSRHGLFPLVLPGGTLVGAAVVQTNGSFLFSLAIQLSTNQLDNSLIWSITWDVKANIERHSIKRIPLPRPISALFIQSGLIQYHNQKYADLFWNLIKLYKHQPPKYAWFSSLHYYLSDEQKCKKYFAILKKVTKEIPFLYL